MTRLAVAVISFFCFATPLLASTEESADATWQTYVDSTYQVTLRFPGDWKRDPLIYRDRPYFAPERRLHVVQRGFFQLLVEGGENHTPEQVCKGAAEHILRPFGENPTVRRMTVQGQSACLVWPSKDHGAPWDAEVVIKYPEPVEIDGDSYSLLVLDADKDYILAIIRTLRFLSSTHENAPFLIKIAPENSIKPGTAMWKAGTPVSVVLTMKNTSQRVLHFALTDPLLDYRMTVLNVRWGERVTATENFRRIEKELKQGHTPTRKVWITLKPQETCQDTIEVSYFYDLERPGQYAVQIERDMPPELGKGIVESNTIRLTLID